MTGAVLTVGETMALLDPEGDLEHGGTIRLRVAGAESNFAIALVRLGVPVRWVSRLGVDPLGDVILDAISSEGVDVTLVIRDPDAPTGLFYKARSNGATAVHYYRKGSAASRLSVGDICDDALDGVGLVHLSGITMALSTSACELVVDLASRAHRRGITVLFDLNWRAALWQSPGDAAVAAARVLPFTDWVLCGSGEGSLLFGGETPEETIAAIRAAGAADAVVRIGERGAALVVDGTLVTIAPERIVDVVDEVGAGDGFAGGFAYGLLQGWDPCAAAETANRLAAAALQGSGDWETLPFLGDLTLSAVGPVAPSRSS